VELYLSGNSFYHIPDIGRSKSTIEVLNLERNQVCTVPRSISEMHSLKMLFLHGNCFTEFPNELLCCASLEMLFLQDNKIRIIPSAISDMSKLRCLFLGNNRIEHLPDAVFSMPNLVNLSVENNSITERDERGEALLVYNLAGNPLLSNIATQATARLEPT